MTANAARKTIHEMAVHSRIWHEQTPKEKEKEEIASITVQLRKLEKEVERISNNKPNPKNITVNLNSDPYFHKEHMSVIESTLEKFIEESAKKYAENSKMLHEFKTSSETIFKEHGATIIRIENEINQLRQVIHNKLSTPNYLKAITTTSEFATKPPPYLVKNQNSIPMFLNMIPEEEEIIKDLQESEKLPMQKPHTKPYRPPIPYPGWLKKGQDEALQKKFLESLRQFQKQNATNKHLVLRNI